MLITLRKKKTNELVVKDYLDIDFDMSVVEDDSNHNHYYVVKINQMYISNEKFRSRKEAEDYMVEISEARNTLELKFYEEC